MNGFIDFIIARPGGDGFALPPERTVLRSPQYGPAWVADCYGSTHEERVAALTLASWTIDPNLRDEVAVAYARLLDNQVGIDLNQSTGSAS